MLSSLNKDIIIITIIKIKIIQGSSFEQTW